MVRRHADNEPASGKTDHNESEDGMSEERTCAGCNHACVCELHRMLIKYAVAGGVNFGCYSPAPGCMHYQSADAVRKALELYRAAEAPTK